MLAIAVLTVIVKETGDHLLSCCNVVKYSLVSFRSSRTRCGFVIVVLDIECERLSLLPLFVSVGFFGFIWKEWTRNTFEDVEILASKAQRDVQLAVEYLMIVFRCCVAAYQNSKV